MDYTMYCPHCLKMVDPETERGFDYMRWRCPDCKFQLDFELFDHLEDSDDEN